MTTGELLLVRLAPSITRALAKAWISDDVLVTDTTSSLTEFFGRAGLGRYERRRAARDFEAVGEKVIERLEVFLLAEQPGGLPDHEAQAAVSAVADTIDAGFTDPKIVIEANAEALLLERALGPVSKRIVETALLNELAERLYEFTLRESCAYLVQMVTELPRFVPQALTELLSRTAALQELLERALAALPEPEAVRVKDFETRYRRAIASLDEMTLIGLRVSRASQRYALSIAYVSLVVSISDDDDYDYLDRDDEDSATTIAVEGLVGSKSLLLITGVAGSGKTTILQWLAVRAASKSFSSALGHLNGVMPFLIRLRAYAERPLPTPPQFVDGVSKSIAALTPSGWVEGLLDAGTALVLIDGIDELSLERRGEVSEWIEDLHAQFPRARIIVTSRPEALELWESPSWFVDGELAPMSLSAVDTFVDHWHRAAAHGLTDPVAREALVENGERLKSSLRSQGPLRRLATNPLMCAVICALNGEGDASLPESRLELYETALEFLLDTRDARRKIHPFPFHLSKDQRRLLLKDLAWWMVSNGHAEADAADVVEQISMIAPRIDGELDPVSLLRYLVERTGLLRKPTADRVDFVHKTFLEYLAALHVVDRNDLGLLVNLAHDAAFSEVVILAAGSAAPERRDRMIRQMLDRAEAEPEHRSRLVLMAAQCDDVAPDLDPKLRASIRARLDALIPPRNLRDANSLAAAGDVAVPMLSPDAEFSPEERRFSVRALARIGTPAAMSQLGRYGQDGSIAVVRELVEGWDAFDRNEYAREVMAASPLDHGALTVEGTDRLEFLQWLGGLRHLRLEAADSIDVLGLSKAVALQSLEIRSPSGLEDLGSLSVMESLRSLKVLHAPWLHSLHGLETLALERLDIEDAPRLTSLDVLVHAESTLQTLTLKDVDVMSLEPLAHQQALTELVLALGFIETLQPIEELGALKRLTLRSSADQLDLQWLALAPSLRHLEITDFRGDLAFEPFGLGGQGLERLRLARCPGVVSFDMLGRLGAVRQLSLEDVLIQSLDELVGVVATNTLESLEIAQSPVRTLGRLPLSLTEATLNRVRVEDWANLTVLPRLEALTLAGVSTDLAWLPGVSGLRTLRLGALEHHRPRFDVLKELPHLSTIDPGPYRGEIEQLHLDIELVSPDPLGRSSASELVLR